MSGFQDPKLSSGVPASTDTYGATEDTGYFVANNGDSTDGSNSTFNVFTYGTGGDKTLSFPGEPLADGVQLYLTLVNQDDSTWSSGPVEVHFIDGSSEQVTDIAPADCGSQIEFNHSLGYVDYYRFIIEDGGGIEDGYEVNRCEPHIPSLPLHSHTIPEP